MYSLRYALGVGLLIGYEKYKTSRLSQKFVKNWIPSVLPSLGLTVLAADRPKVSVNHVSHCPPTGDTDAFRIEEPLIKSKCRSFYVAGNLKMYATKIEIDEIGRRLKKAKMDPKHAKSVLPKCIKLAAPNCYHKGMGPITGEVSPFMVKEVGADWVVAGQSDRRMFFGETDDIIGQKTCRALHDGLKVMICVGEIIEARESGRNDDGLTSFTVLDNQLRTIASHVSNWSDVVLVYEPIWAFGTGKKCLPEDAQIVHHFIRGWLEQNISYDVAESTRIIYGGVVANGKEAALYAREEDIDGFFVGYQTIKPDFIDIVNVIQDTNKEIEDRKKARAKELKAAAKKK